MSATAGAIAFDLLGQFTERDVGLHRTRTSNAPSAVSTEAPERARITLSPFGRLRTSTILQQVLMDSLRGAPLDGSQLVADVQRT